MAAVLVVFGSFAASRAAVPCDPLQEARILGAAWYAHGPAGEARDALATAAELSPDVAADLVNAGLGALAADDAATARPYLERALELAPDLAPAWLALGLAAKRQGDLEDAQDAFRRCGNAGGGGPRLAYEIASVEARLGSVEAAGRLARLYAAARGDRSPDRRPALLPVPSPVDGIESLPAFVPSPLPAPDGIRWADAADLDGDGDRDLLLGDGQTLRDLRRTRDGWVDVTASRGLAGLLGVTMARAVDLDGDGAVDLVRAGGGGVAVHWGIEGGWEPPRPVCRETVTRVLALDFDLDGDPDLLAAAAGGPRLFRNRGDRTFDDVTAGSRLEDVGAVATMASGDLDGDGDGDVLFAARDGRLLVASNERGGRFALATVDGAEAAGAYDLALADLDGDGDLDIVTGGTRGVRLVVSDGPLAWTLVGDEPTLPGPVRWPTPGGSSLWADDLDGDGRPDLLVARETGGEIAMNRDALRFVSTTGSLAPLAAAGAWPVAVGRIDDDALPDVVGSSAAVALGRSAGPGDDGEAPATPAPAPAPPSPVGLRLVAADDDSVVLAPALLGGARLGLPSAPGDPARPPAGEVVRVPPDRLPLDGAGAPAVRVRADAPGVAWLDRVRLVAVDHPAGVEVQPGTVLLPPTVPPAEPGVRALDAVRMPVRAADGRGRDVTDRLLAADGFAVDDLSRTRYAGVTREHVLEVDFGDVPPEVPLTLFLSGTNRPATASSRLAVSQDPRRGLEPPTLQVPDGLGGWLDLPTAVELPWNAATAVAVDLAGAFPAGRARIRIATTRDVAWDRARLQVGPPAVVPRVTALLPASAELVTADPSAIPPDATADPVEPGPPADDAVTRLQDADDRTLVLRTGDACLVRWNPDALPSLAPGAVRTFLLVFDGWAKDDDPNTATAGSVEPLPFRAMSVYPPPPTETAWTTTGSPEDGP